MHGLGTSSSEADVNAMMRAHTLEREGGAGVWSSELSQLQESQRREYREWVLKLHEETVKKVKGQTIELLFVCTSKPLIVAPLKSTLPLYSELMARPRLVLLSTYYLLTVAPLSSEQSLITTAALA